MAYHCQHLCLLGVFLGPASSVTGVAGGGQSTPRAVLQPPPTLCGGTQIGWVMGVEST